MYNLVSGWILWYISFSWMPCSLIKPCLKTKTKNLKNCVLLSGIPPRVVAQRGMGLSPQVRVVVWTPDPLRN